ncbi:MAG: CpsB/CapC family capsule biosynthesis tyrosine phosphatase [Acidobacteriota bacterium]
MIDLHSHLLPGIDDGADDLDQALAMCRLAAADGCTAIVATPHLRHELYWNDERQEIVDLWRRLRDADPGIEVLLGGEIAVCAESLAEIDLLPGGELLSLAGGRYLLLEFNSRGLGPDPVEMVYELCVLGWRPLIAHPERIPWLARDLDLVAALVDHGAALQLTAMSVTGDLGWRLQERSHEMLDAGLVHVVASDAHNTGSRPPGLARAFDHVRKRCGEETARALFIDHPRTILENKPIEWVARQAPRAAKTGAGLAARLRRLAGR